MKELEQMKINVIPQGSELVIRHGDAEKIVYPKSISLTGTLAAPFQFLQGRGIFDQERTHLQIDTNNSKISLVVGDTDPHTTHNVTGQLTYNAELLAFSINTPKRWTIRDFVKFCRERKFFFADASEHG